MNEMFFLEVTQQNKIMIFFSITQVIDETLPDNRIDFLPERYKETLLRKTDLTMQEEKISERTGFIVTYVFRSHVNFQFTKLSYIQ